MKKIYTIILMFLTTMIASATIHTVSVLSSSFSSAVVNVVCGDTVIWQWTGGSHTTTSTAIPSCATSWNALIDGGNPVFAIVIPCAGTYNYECTPHGFTGVINATCSTGIDDAGADNNSLFVSPNPSADGIFNLTFTGNGSLPKRIYVLSADGRKIMDVGAIHESPVQSSAEINFTINLQSCASGIYFLVFDNEKERRVFKLVR